jgi:(S)-2-hydroxyglutarate dehydrogenase
MVYDYIITGGGIVGLSVGMALIQRHPGARLLVIEKENACAQHQTGNNSGVIHSGIYYKPGSLKARYAVEGSRVMAEFCAHHGIKHEICGKVIVASLEHELPLLENLYNRGLQNGLKLDKLTPDQLKEIEPHCVGLAALRVYSTGIADYKGVTCKYADIIQQHGGEVRFSTTVTGLRKQNGNHVVETTAGEFETRMFVNCGGLHSDRLARMDGVDPRAKIVPFRGEYFELKPEKRYLVKHLIYPVPDPQFPFLGVHYTRMIDGNIHCGPNAVLALKREGYSWGDISIRDTMETLTYKGFWKLAKKNWREGFREMYRSLSKKAFTKSLQLLIPEVQEDDLVPSHAGVRAQALQPDGKMIDDFLIVQGEGSVHVCNAPSPAATASIPIGRAVAEVVPAPTSTKVALNAA